MGAAEAICDKLFGIVAHAERAGFVEAGAGNIDFSRAEIFAAAGADELLGGVLGVLPHQKGVAVPGKVKAGGGDAVDVFDGGVDIDKVIVTALGRSLDVEAYGGWIAAFNFTLEIAAEAGDGIVLAGESGAAAVRVNGIAANEVFFARIV